MQCNKEYNFYKEQITMLRHTPEDIQRNKVRFMTTQDPVTLKRFKQICDRRLIKYSTQVDALLEDYIRKYEKQEKTK